MSVDRYRAIIVPNTNPVAITLRWPRGDNLTVHYCVDWRANWVRDIDAIVAGSPARSVGRRQRTGGWKYERAAIWGAAVDRRELRRITRSKLLCQAWNRTGCCDNRDTIFRTISLRNSGWAYAAAETGRN